MGGDSRLGKRGRSVNPPREDRDIGCVTGRGKGLVSRNTRARENQKNKDVWWDCFTDLMMTGTVGKGTASAEKEGPDLDQTSLTCLRVIKCWRKEAYVEGRKEHTGVRVFTEGTAVVLRGESRASVRVGAALGCEGQVLLANGRRLEAGEGSGTPGRQGGFPPQCSCPGMEGWISPEGPVGMEHSGGRRKDLRGGQQNIQTSRPNKSMKGRSCCQASGGASVLG